MDASMSRAIRLWLIFTLALAFVRESNSQQPAAHTSHVMQVGPLQLNDNVPLRLVSEASAEPAESELVFESASPGSAPMVEPLAAKADKGEEES